MPRNHDFPDKAARWCLRIGLHAHVPLLSAGRHYFLGFAPSAPAGGTCSPPAADFESGVRTSAGARRDTRRWRGKAALPFPGPSRQGKALFLKTNK